MAASNFVAVSQIVTRERVPMLLLICVIIFSLTLPFNCFVYILDDDFSEFHKERPSERIQILQARFMVLMVLNIAGFAVMFFHFGLIPGVLFLLSIIYLFLHVFPRGERGNAKRFLYTIWLSLFRSLPPEDSE